MVSLLRKIKERGFLVKPNDPAIPAAVPLRMIGIIAILTRQTAWFQRAATLRP